MQRSFSTFPSGWPGAGLLLLRLTVGTTSLVEGFYSLTTPEPPTWGLRIASGLAIISGLALLIGLFTPPVAALISAGNSAAAFLPLRTTLFYPFGSWLALAFFIAMATAIVLLGPGAFSLDARLFGRREIVIPLAARPPDSEQ